jgi:Aspartyl protease
MRTYPFTLEDEDILILVDCHSAGENLVFALDTGASSTVIDLAALIVAGYSVEDAIGKAELETANGCVEALVFVLREFQALGITRRNMEICAYDFFGADVFAAIHGTLGLDFFKNTDLLISFKRFEISIN